jgi:histidinol-phosphate aminotransferase
MTGYVPGEQPRDGQVIKLNTNENPYPPSPRVAEALAGLDIDRLRRYPDPVCSELRDYLAESHGVDADQVLVGNGSDEVLALCLRAFVERDGTVGYFDPSYSLYPVLAQIEDVATKPVALAKDFQWAMPEGYSASLFFLAYPNAPTGIAYDQDTIRAFCASFPGVVLIDEAYVDFAPVNCMSLVADFDHVLVARTLSKSYSLAGIRLGYAVGPRELIGALYKIKDSYNVNAVTQALALAALQDGDYFRDVIRRIIRTRERMAGALRAVGFEMQPSATNFLWAKPTFMPAHDLFEALRQRRIYVRYFPGERTGEHVRISIGTDEQMDCLLETVREIQKN